MNIDVPVVDGKEPSHQIREFEVQNEIYPSFLASINNNCTQSH